MLGFFHPFSARRLAGPGRTSGGFTLVEAMVTVLVLATLASVTVPVLGPLRSRFAAEGAAVRFALALRLAQALAQAEQCRFRVRLTEAGQGFVVERLQGAAPQAEERGDLTGTKCSTNFPGDGVDFTAAGWPLALGTSTPRAGTFTFGSGSAAHAVVVQLTGRVRCR